MQECIEKTSLGHDIEGSTCVPAKAGSTGHSSEAYDRITTEIDVPSECHALRFSK